MKIPKNRAGQINELESRLEAIYRIDCCAQASTGCERREETTDALDENHAASQFYDQGWRVKKLINPPGFKEGLYYLAVCPHCAKAERA